PWRTRDLRADQRLHLGHQGPPALHRHRHAGARRRFGVAGEEQPARIGQAGDPALVHLEAAYLVGGAEPVLQTPYQSQRGMPVALELEYDVDQVLQDPRTGDLAVLGDVADEHRRDPAFLGDRDERG